MNLAVISDLHLGKRDRVDRFGHEDAAFLRFLDRLEASFERIVLLGDIWETLAGPLPARAARELRAAREAHPGIAARFSGPRYAYVHGNHDFVAGRVDGAPSELVLEADGVRLLFTHGHVFDWIVRHARWASEAGVWLGTWTERLGLGALVRRLRAIDAVVGPSFADAANGFQRAAVAAARARGADVVVTGHTHVAARVEHGDRLFLNSGSCSGGAFSFLGIDTRAGVFALHDWP